MNIKDTIALAFKTVRGNRLRTGITVAIIAFGIMALVGIITAIQAMNASLKDSFATMGANSFSIRFRERQIRFGDGGGDVTKTSSSTNKKVKKSNAGKPITYEQAKAFKERYSYPAKVSIGLGGVGDQTVFFENKKNQPQCSGIGRGRKLFCIERLRGRVWARF